MNRRLLVRGALVLGALLVAIGIYAYVDSRPTEKRGSADEEFDRSAGPKRPAPRQARLIPWPTYAFDQQRTHVSPYRHRPPYRRVWTVDARDTIEFPPSVGYGRVFIPQQKGLFLAVDSRTGKVAWKRQFRRCAASSPTLANGLVYQAYMDFVPCPQDRPGATGFLIAMDPRTGRQRWRFNTAPIESTPLHVKGTLYFGAWDHNVYALDARTGRKRWSFQADDQLNTSAAYWRGTVYIASDGGSVYALSARTGRLVWKAQSNATFGSREFFYATPTIAYGRVYIGNTDGTMYVFGARTGALRWARPLGTYIYGAAAVSGRRVFVGTYDGAFYSLDAATGDVKWKRTAASAVHSAATVMGDLVYYATCNSCGTTASRAVKFGKVGTYAVRARDGRPVWNSADGWYASPVLADEQRAYVVGRGTVTALADTRRR